MAAMRNNFVGMTYVALIVINLFPVMHAQILNVASCSGGNNGNLDAQTTLTTQNPGNILYATQISNQIYTAGSIITVTFQPLSISGNTFQEIILQARLVSASVDTSSMPVGTFTLINGEEIANNADFTILNCNSGSFGSTVATTNADSKMLPVTFTYQAPDPPVGAIHFVFTIVQSPAEFYERITSQAFDTPATGPGPVIISCPGNIVQPSNNNTSMVLVSWDEPVGSGTADPGNRASADGVFEVGALSPTTVTYRYSLGGLTNECTFTVLVPNTSTTGPCQPSPCVNGGSCQIDSTTPSGVRCINCATGFAGVLCAEDLVIVQELPQGVFASDNIRFGMATYADGLVRGWIIQGTANLVIMFLALDIRSGDILRYGAGSILGVADIDTFNGATLADINLDRRMMSLNSNIFWLSFTTNNDGNAGTGFAIRIQQGISNILPVATCPNDVSEFSLINNVGNFVSFPDTICSDTEDAAGSITAVCDRQSGSFFQGLGSTEVSCTCTDSAGDSNTCTFNVIVLAFVTPNIPPTITCPVDLTVKVTLGATGDLVTFNPPVCIDPDQNNQNLAVSCNPMGNSFLPLGSHTVTCSCTDLSGLTDTCSFTVTVFENTPPTITCPASVTVISLPGNIGNTATYNAPQCFDAEDNQNQLQTSCSQPSGAFFQGVGPTTVTCTCTDSCQDTDSCTFIVNIDAPNIPPIITCPADLTVKVTLGATGDLVTFNPPVCIDPDQNNQNLAVSCNPMDNSFLPLGSNTVTCTCTDLSGATDTCSFTVTVFLSENTPPTITCPASVTVVSLPGNIGNTATYNPPQCFDAEDNQNQLQTSCSQPSGAFFQGVGPTTVTCTCTDSCQDTDSCTFIVNIDAPNIPPTITCPADLTVKVTPGATGDLVTFNPPICTDPDQNNQNLAVSCNPMGNSFLPLGSNTVICTCTDLSGATETCSFTVTVFALNTAPTFTNCPSAVTFTTDDNSTSAVANYGPYICFDDEQGLLSAECNPIAGRLVSIGVHQVICNCFDDGGLQDTCIFNVIVLDVIINCPERPIVVNTTELLTRVFWPKPITSSLGDDLLAVMSNFNSGDNFAIGNTKIQYRYQNLHCEFTVIVQESQKDISRPIVYNCPHGPITVAVQSLHDKVTLTLPEPFADDDSCDQVTATSSGNLNDSFCVGLTTVTYNFTDSSGNVAQCVIQVNVSVIERDTKGDDFPMFEFCPRPISINGSSELATRVTWPEPVLSDSMPNLLLQQSHFSGDLFPIGTTNVVYKLSDMHNRQRLEFCNFSITVNDVTPPTIFNCPENITVKSCRGRRNVSWSDPFARDNSGDPTTVWQTHNPGNETFHFGTTNVIYFFKDESNNEAECSFIVTVHADGCYVNRRVLITAFAIGIIVLIVLYLCTICMVRCCHNRNTAGEAT